MAAFLRVFAADFLKVYIDARETIGEALAPKTGKLGVEIELIFRGWYDRAPFSGNG